MSYSCTTKASMVKEELLIQLQASEIQWGDYASNGWVTRGKRYFEECGKERSDGAITGAIYVHTDEYHCQKIGSYRIDPDGRIVRWSTTTKAQRGSAMTTGLIKYHEQYEPGWDNDSLLRSLVGDAQFVVV